MPFPRATPLLCINPTTVVHTEEANDVLLKAALHPYTQPRNLFVLSMAGERGVSLKVDAAKHRSGKLIFALNTAEESGVQSTGVRGLR